MRKISVSLNEYNPIVNEEGEVGYSLEKVAELKGILLPYTSVMAQQIHGYHSNPSFKFYTKNLHNALAEGNVITYGNKNYFITSIVDYGKIKEVLLSFIVGKSTVKRVVQSYFY